MSMPGSYANGFAPRDGQPLYPDLWRGCVGAWAACLGPTGLTLRDWSGYGNHGTLTGLTVQNAWDVSDGRYSNKFSGASGYINCDRVPAIESQSKLTLCFWYRRSSAGAIIELSKFASTSSVLGVEIYSDGNIYLEPTSGLSNYGRFAQNDTAWHHLAVVFDGTQSSNSTRLRVLLDGREKSLTFTGTIATSTASATGDFSIGKWSGLYSNGSVDDVMVFTTVKTDTEIQRLASRRGIAYEMAPRRRSSVQVVTGNRRRRLLIGASL